MRMPLRVPSERSDSTRNSARPRQAGVGALGPRQRRDRARVDVGAEPLRAVEHPRAVLLRRDRVAQREVGAAADLRHEHRAVPGVVERDRLEVRQHALAHVGRRVAVDEALDAAGHAGRADHARVGLAEQVRERGAEHRRDGLALAALAVRALLPDVALVRDGVRVVDDLADLVAPLVVALELRRVAVDTSARRAIGPPHSSPQRTSSSSAQARSSATWRSMSARRFGSISYQFRPMAESNWA